MKKERDNEFSDGKGIGSQKYYDEIWILLRTQKYNFRCLQIKKKLYIYIYIYIYIREKEVGETITDSKYYFIK